MSATRQLLLAIFMIGASQFAQATISTPMIVPSPAVSSDFLTVRVTTAVCDIFATLGPNDRQLEVVGNLVRMTVEGTSVDDFAQCNFPMLNYVFNIGNLAAADYRFELYRRISLEPNRIDLVGTTNFTVTGAATPLVTQVPAVSALGIVSLCGLMLLAVFGTRKWF